MHNTQYTISGYKGKPSKHFNVVSTLFLGWYDVVTSNQRQIKSCERWKNVKLTLKQRCIHQRWSLQPWATSNQRFQFQRWLEQRQSTSKQRCHFQWRFSQHWATLKQRYEYDHMKRKPTRQIQNNILCFKEK